MFLSPSLKTRQKSFFPFFLTDVNFFPTSVSLIFLEIPNEKIEHSLIRLRSNQAREVRHEVGARVHPELQAAAGLLHQAQRRQGPASGQTGEGKVPGQLRVYAVVQQVLHGELRRVSV